MTTANARVVSGMRPTGQLHLGHLVGALNNWVALQEKYECFYFIADWHALTSDFADTSRLTSFAYENAADWIAAGLDPERSTLFVQSLVPEHAELFLLLSMVVPVSWLERVPTYKEQQENLTEKDLSGLGFLSYPLLQTADVAIYDGRFVPVGEDQVAHLELARESVRRFNNFFGDVLVEPQPLLTTFARLPGLDGDKKMSKSLGNTIHLSDSADDVKKKVMRMYTDRSGCGPISPARWKGIPSSPTTTRSIPTPPKWTISRPVTAPGRLETSRSRPSWPTRSTLISSRYATGAPPRSRNRTTFAISSSRAPDALARSPCRRWSGSGMR